MPKLVPLQTIVVQRDKVMMSPPIGEPFEFTAEEIAQIKKMNPNGVTDEATVNLTKEAAKTVAKAKDDI